MADIWDFPQMLPDRIQVSSPSKDQQSNGIILLSHRTNAILDYLAKYQYVSWHHITLLVMWRVPA